MNAFSKLGDALIACSIGALVWLAFQSRTHEPAQPIPIAPAPIIVPIQPIVPDDTAKKPPKKPLLPWRSLPGNESFTATVNGRTGPDGKGIDCDLPVVEHHKNIPSKGLGCCVFRSISHAAAWQNVPCLYSMPEWMVEKGIEGGGYPSKVDTLVKQIALDRHAPVPDYIQVEGNDLEILKLACKSGRMPCVTYNRSLTGRYNGQNIAHMVNLVRADDDFIAVLDNNYIGDTNYEYLSPEEFKRVYGSGWCVILLASSPPPPPHP